MRTSHLSTMVLGLFLNKGLKKITRWSNEHDPFPVSLQPKHKEQREGIRTQLWAELFLSLDIWGSQPGNVVSCRMQIEEGVHRAGAVAGSGWGPTSQMSCQVSIVLLPLSPRKCSGPLFLPILKKNSSCVFFIHSVSSWGRRRRQSCYLS